jgi:prevent-host-death family protein
MQQWQVQEAKAQFSEVIRLAITQSPQIISRHGKEIAAVVPISYLRAGLGLADNLLDFFAKAPRMDLNIERDLSAGRSVSF